MKPLILITGAYGQLGQSFQELAVQYDEMSFLFTSRAQLDITDEHTVTNFFQKHQLHACINAAAYTAVDLAEQEADKALQTNVTAVYHLAKAAAQRRIPFIHFSTDYVYHNELNRPLRETDPLLPRSVYARTKLKGEQMAQQVHPASTIFRTSWVYSRHGHNFLKTMLRLAQERSQLQVVYDQVGAPTWAQDLAQAILDILRAFFSGQLSGRYLSGIFNYANEGVSSWYDFAKAIFKLTGSSCQVLPIRSEQYHTAAPRPHYSLLDKSRFRKTFQLDIPHWHDSLERCLSEMELHRTPTSTNHSNNNS